MAAPTRWVTDNPSDHAVTYAERFRRMAAEGKDLGGEARLVDAMLPRGSRVLDAGCGQGRGGAALHAAGHEVVAVDQRGHGGSEQTVTGYDTATAAADLAELIALRHWTGKREPVVAGQSWGGNVVLTLAALHGGVPAGVVEVFLQDGLADKGKLIHLQEVLPVWREHAGGRGISRNTHIVRPAPAVEAGLADTLDVTLVDRRHELLDARGVVLVEKIAFFVPSDIHACPTEK